MLKVEEQMDGRMESLTSNGKRCLDFDAEIHVGGIKILGLNEGI